MDPAGPDEGTHKVARGGGWNSGSGDLRTSRRFKMDPTRRYDTVGFRCVKPF
ncbi:MAG: SUMF1/EgtB/PvdO family nonheme iron enzyme [Deltaproteobacteria bacterium]|nr:SUMF1/EgtB/PvdO family nonheme iron enzyme [Deltaproteobacteria bacterium]